jgi:hypothetical protein
MRRHRNLLDNWWSSRLNGSPLGSLGGGGFSLPYTVDFATISDGGLPPVFSGATWSVSSGKASNIPTTGNDLLTDGGLENWSSATNLTSWTEAIAGTSTVNKETGDIYAGTAAARLDIDGSNSLAKISQQISGGLAIGNWIKFEFWAKASASGKSLNAGYTNSIIPGGGSYTPTTSYSKITSSGHILTLTGGSFTTLEIYKNSAASSSIYLDDVAIKKINVPTLFATINANKSNVTTKAAWNIIRGLAAGVVMNLDSATSPLNFVLCYHIGAANTIHLIKCVNGTYSDVLINQLATYVAGANVELRKTAATTYQVWYNGAQIGADQTISDAGIINNTLHGIFSVEGGNTLDRFFVG